MSYLQKVHSETATRFWVNNPSPEECRRAIDGGAVSCTTNPAYCSKLFQSDPEFIHAAIKKVLATEKDINAAAEAVYHNVSAELMKLFLPVFEASGGKDGFVTVQEDPRREEDTGYIIEASLRSRKLAPNYMSKIPVTACGLRVIEEMVKNNIPICATEVFSLSQAVTVYHLYQEFSKKYGNRPPLFITHITGIMDQYFKDLAEKEKIPVSPEALKLAGTAIALKEYHLFQREGYGCKMLGGGARGLEHFTNFVGGDLHITINWSTAVELNQKNLPVEAVADKEIPASIISELKDKLPNFSRAYEEGAMVPEEFADYGPVMLFRTQFMNGFARLIDAIRIALKGGQAGRG
jgi:transaldolase